MEISEKAIKKVLDEYHDEFDRWILKKADLKECYKVEGAYKTSKSIKIEQACDAMAQKLLVKEQVLLDLGILKEV